MIISPAVVYLLVSAVLFTVAVVVHFHTSTLSLPLSPLISIAAILLPILSFLNAFIHPTLLDRSHSSSRRITQLTPLILQTLQALITAIIATLLFERVAPSQTLDCLLDNQWMHMFRAHDADSIRRIQDALSCCGLNSVKDRAYPFVNGKPSKCAEIYGRSVACKGPWRAAMQNTTGVDLGVVLAVGVMQIIGLLMMKSGTSWWTAWRTQGSRLPNGVYESRRPLLTAAADGDEETAERQDSGRRSYGGINGVQTNGAGDSDESGPRVQPSVVGERNAWRDE